MVDRLEDAAPNGDAATPRAAQLDSPDVVTVSARWFHMVMDRLHALEVQNQQLTVTVQSQSQQLEQVRLPMTVSVILVNPFITC